MRKILIRPVTGLKRVTRLLSIAGIHLIILTGLGLSVTLAASGAWNVDSDGDWNDAVNWDGVDYPDGLTDSATFGPAISAPRTVTIDGEAIRISEVRFNSANGYTVTGANGGTLTFDSVGNGQVSASSGQHVLSATTILSRNVLITTTGSLTISGNISDDGGGRTLTKDGSGILILGQQL